MDFLVLFIAYFSICLSCFGCYILDCPLLQYAPVIYLRSLGLKTYVVILRFTPKPIQELGEFLYEYLFFERNAVFQAIYIVLVLAGHAVTFFDTLPFLYAKEPHINHTTCITVIFAINCVLFVLASYTDPGVITPDNITCYGSLYEYDDVMYKPGLTCWTCELERIPRSKHCAIYNKCIHKFDHYCAWTNNCVGGLNQRYFISCLVSVTAMALNALIMNANALVNIVELSQLWRLRYVDNNGQPQPMDFHALVQTLFMQYPRIVFMVASMSAVFICMLTFTFYHVFLVLTNQTTNERYKKHNLKKKNVELSESTSYNRGVFHNIMDTVFPLRRQNSQTSKHRRKPEHWRPNNSKHCRIIENKKERYRKSCKF